MGGQPAGRADSARPRRKGWPGLFDWEDTFDDEPDIDGALEEDRYAEIGPYDPPRRAGAPS